MVNQAMVNISGGTALLVAVAGYLVVFLGLVLLMLVIILAGKVLAGRGKSEEAAVVEKAAPAPTPKPEPVLASGSAGELKLYDTDPRTAAMIMAIVADNLGKPINELRFKSIKEVK